jgi:cysteine desulfurase
MIMRKQPIFLDYNSTTPCFPEAVEAMLPFFSEKFANPSSAHFAGREVSRALEGAREKIGNFVGAWKDEIVFTSGATEANTTLLLGCSSINSRRRRIVVSAGEHKSIIAPCERLKEQGFDIRYAPLTSDGVIDLQKFSDLVDDSTLLVSVQTANNETGVKQPIEEASKIARAQGALVHSDISQILGKSQFSLHEIDVDFASASGHKMYAPKGIGFLYARQSKNSAKLLPLLLGGGQERGIRSGTQNIPAIIAMSKACDLLQKSLAEDISRIQRIRDNFEKQIASLIAGAIFVGSKAERLPGTSCVILPGVPADLIITRVNDLAISLAAACSSRSFSPSHVVLACGYDRDLASSAFRVSFGRYSTEEEGDYAAQRIAKSALSCRNIPRTQG